MTDPASPRPISVQRMASVPDPLRIARAARAPELGPRLLFFSGGSALRPLSRVLKQYTHNSIHLITVFDSGGSSARLRQAFGMSAIGDLRNRVVALADESVRGNPQVYRLFSYRLPTATTPPELLAELRSLTAGEHPLVADIPEPMRQIVRTHLRFFTESMPDDFDLRGANVGNLLLAGGFLSNDRDLDCVLFLFSQLLQVRGVVRPIVDADLHLFARLDSGERIVGQHLLTGKAHPPIDSPVAELSLVSSLADPQPASAQINAQVARDVASADLICFPMGSFYSSVLANLLPRGVGRAVAKAGAPRVYVPNTGVDPEQLGLSLVGCVQRLVDCVSRDVDGGAAVDQVVNLVLLDREHGHYAMRPDVDALTALGVSVIQLDLVTTESHPHIDPRRLTEALISLI